MPTLELNNVHRKPLCEGAARTELVVVYDGRHSNGKTTLHFQAIVQQVPGGFTAKIDFGDSFGKDGLIEGSIEKALKRLGQWCQRAGETLLSEESLKKDQAIPF